jgi:hypothetical protein
MMFSRIIATAGSAAVVITLLGCVDGDPKFDPAASYSPESLAQELSFRYKMIDRTKDDTVGDPGAVGKSGVTKGGAASKKARTDTFGGMIEEISGKIGLIPGMSRAEAAKRVVELVSGDPSIPEADRKTIAEKMTRPPADGR